MTGQLIDKMCSTIYGSRPKIGARLFFCTCLLALFISGNSNENFSAQSLCPNIDPATAMSATGIPISQYFLPRPGKHFRLPSPGSREVLSKYQPGMPYQLIELRGWLRAVDSSCNPSDPDWHYMLELDPEWTNSLGINLNDLIKAGNYLDGGYITEDMRKTIRINDWFTYDNYSFQESEPIVVSRPIVKIELNGIFAEAGTVLPSDWTWDTHGYYDTGTCLAYSKRGAVGPLPVLWAYDPLNPVCGQPALDQYDKCQDWTYSSQQPACGGTSGAGSSSTPGWYVRVVGSLLTDSPHAYGEDIFGTWTCRWLNWLCNSRRNARVRSMHWSGDRADSDENNPARWTEIHPPDIIGILPYKYPSETARSILLMSLGSFRILDVDIAPPGPSPGPGARVVWKETVASDSNLPSIIEGNSQGSGAKVTAFSDHIHVHIGVVNKNGQTGKFRATYQVRWENLPLTLTKKGSGTGTVQSSPPGIDCGGTCVGSFVGGSAVQLTAKADPGSFISGWSPTGRVINVGDYSQSTYSINALTASYQNISVNIVKCITPQIRCANQCINLQTDPDHCGSCDKRCDPGYLCQSGSCVKGCTPGRGCVDMYGQYYCSGRVMEVDECGNPCSCPNDGKTYQCRYCGPGSESCVCNNGHFPCSYCYAPP